MRKFIFYAARSLSLIIVAFFAIFILEGFSPGFGWEDSVMHLLVALVALGVAVMAWKWPKIGGFVFIIFGMRYIGPAFIILGMRYINPMAIPEGAVLNLSGLFIGGVPILTGILFLIEEYCGGKSEPSRAKLRKKGKRTRMN